MVDLDHELHVHLYGCLTADDVWMLGRDRYRQLEDRLEWFAGEYHRAYGIRPPFRDFWNSDSQGLDLLKRFYHFRQPAPFSHFQACFNLLIALFPDRAEDPAILRRVMDRQRRQGIVYADYRLLFPRTFGRQQLDQYFTALCQTAIDGIRQSGGTFDCGLIMHLPRDPQVCAQQYQLLKEWRQAHPKLAKAIRGIDFCQDEEGHPPKLMKGFFERVIRDNADAPELALAILYHVGESFDTFSMESSIRWVVQAAAFGAHRLGHAISLGLDPAMLRGRTVVEPITERIDHLHWLLANHGLLDQCGYQTEPASLRRELESLAAGPASQSITVTYDQQRIDQIRRLQSAALAMVKNRGCVIESCPTSNVRIGRITASRYHPLPRFLEAGLDVVISTDDPGIFDIDLKQEANHCRDWFQLSDAAMRDLRVKAEAATAEGVVTRGLDVG